MNTHILIPIKDIEDIPIYFTNAAPLEYIKTELIKRGKQISLSEEDIEDHLFKVKDQYLSDIAINTTKTQYPSLKGETFDFVRMMFKYAYKQALKDLL